MWHLAGISVALLISSIGHSSDMKDAYAEVDFSQIYKNFDEDCFVFHQYFPIIRDIDELRNSLNEAALVGDIYSIKLLDDSTTYYLVKYGEKKFHIYEESSLKSYSSSEFEAKFFKEGTVISCGYQRDHSPNTTRVKKKSRLEILLNVCCCNKHGVD